MIAFGGQDLATLLGDPEVSTDDRLSGGCAEAASRALGTANGIAIG